MQKNECAPSLPVGIGLRPNIHTSDCRHNVSTDTRCCSDLSCFSHALLRSDAPTSSPSSCSASLLFFLFFAHLSTALNGRNGYIYIYWPQRLYERAYATNPDAKGRRSRYTITTRWRYRGRSGDTRAESTTTTTPGENDTFRRYY